MILLKSKRRKQQTTTMTLLLLFMFVTQGMEIRDSSPKLPRLVLHMDVNKTILMDDPAQGKKTG